VGHVVGQNGRERRFSPSKFFVFFPVTILPPVLNTPTAIIYLRRCMILETDVVVKQNTKNS
jgi:hypothetical protein